MKCEPSGAGLRLLPLVATLPAVVFRRDSVVGRMWQTARHGGFHSRWVLAWSVITVAGTVATPALLDQPVMLLLLAPRTLAVALAAQKLDFVSFLVLGTIRLSMADPSYYSSGRQFAAAPAVSRAPRGPAARLVSWMFGLLGRSRVLAGLVLFVRPSGRYLAVAGAKGVPPGIASTSAITGTITYLAVVHFGAASL